MYNANKFARSVLEVDLSKIEENYRRINSLVGKINVSAAVKANAYGLGAKPIVQRLYKAGCRDFYFAYVDEVHALSEELQGARLYVLNGLHSDEFSYVANKGIIPVLNSFNEVENWNNYAKQQGLILPAVIHIETGMGRVGLQESEVRKLVVSDNIECLDIVYVMGHLACAHNSEHPANQLQLKKIKELSSLFPKVKVSFCNSAGIFLGSRYHMDQVRPGCAIYGINPTGKAETAFSQVATLKAYVLQLRKMEHSQPISYNWLHTTNKGAKIATLACGYADGYHRLLTSNAFGFYEGYRIPIIGTVTMDMVMADVSEVPEQLLNKMQYIELLGDNITVDELAERAKTIGYEILTSLGHRFKRIYKD